MRKVIRTEECSYKNTVDTNVKLCVEHIETIGEQQKNIFMDNIKSYSILRLKIEKIAGHPYFPKDIEKEDIVKFIINTCNNDFEEGTYLQKEVLSKYKTALTDKKDSMLKSEKIYVHDNHRYGDGFLVRELNKNDIDEVFEGLKKLGCK